MKKLIKFFAFLALVIGLTSCSSTAVGIQITSVDNVRMIKAHETLQLEAKVFPRNAKQDVEWSSSDELVATVDDNGLVTGVSRGNVNIIATAKENEEIKQKFALIVEIGETIVVDPTSITISAANNITTVKTGESISLSASVLPKEASQVVVWKSSDETVAKVTRGTVKGVKEGKVTITASPKNFDNITASIEVTVEKNDDPVVTKDWANMAYATHAEYINSEDNTPLKVKGVVTNLVNNGEKVDYFLQDGVNGYYIKDQSASLAEIIVGKSYEVGGFKKNNSSKQINSVEYVKELTETITYEVNNLTGVNTSDLTEMLEFQGSLVSGTATIESLSSYSTTKAYNFTAFVNGYSTTFRVDATYSSAEAVAEINAVLGTAIEGMSFEFEGIALAYGKGTQKPQIQLFDAESIQLETIVPAKYLEMAASKLQVAPSIGFSSTSIALPTKLDKYADVTIAWASNNAAINVQTGAVTHGSEKVVVTLTATLTYQGVTHTKDFQVEVAAQDNKTYQTVLSLDLEDAKNPNPTVTYSDSIKPGYGAGVVSLGSPKANWLLDNALIDGQSNDRTDGEYAIRAKAGGRIEIQQDGEYNAVEFDAAIYGNDTLGMQIRVEYSLDSGKTWIVDDEIVTISSKELETYRFTLPEGVKRVAIVIVPETGNRVNIDNIELLK